jgi:hypothetical protein
MATDFRAAALPVVIAMLGACGGGGGGGGVIAPASEPAPASFASAGANQSIVMEGKSAALDTTVSLAGTGDVTITPTGDGKIDNATVKFRFDGASQLSGIDITSPQASLSFDAVKCQGGVCSGENSSSFAVAIDPSAQGWNYQTFGVWAMEGAQLPGIRMGAMSAGGPTSGNSIPTTGTATFKGLAAGLYIDPAGTLWATAASMRADANFGSRTILFSTSNTLRGADVNVPTSASMPDGNLNLSGTLSYAPGVNNFSGALQSQNGALSGRGEGKFYGPTAQEIGGVYSLSGSGPSRMIGGFGGQR